ncbi:MAG: aminopeptidase P family protein [Deltaproteobacteria bacterium]|nr:aminopeptidase P family protein [Deltaproteobacteria bacterium]MBW2136852.1 aminopeptidase P family protein [Deltaproteobacteria bacterium]
MGDDFTIPLSEIQDRTKRVQTQLQESPMDGLFIVQRVDLFYFSGTAQNGFLYIPADGKPLLFIKKYLPRARKESPIENIIQISTVREIPGLIRDFYGRLPRVLGFELDVIPVNDFNFYRTLFPKQECVDGSPLILRVRMIKSPWEIEIMEEAAEVSWKTFEHMKTLIRPGLTEMEFSGLFEAFARKLGHGGQLRVRHHLTEGYPWHVLSGTNGGMVGLLDSPASGQGTSPAFPCGAGWKELQRDEPIMVDLGVMVKGYHIDETRMFAIGSMPAEALRASEAAISIHNGVLERARPGVTVGELFQHSLTLAERLGYGEPYLGPPGYKVTFIGHGIGLELVEPPIMAKNKDDLLQPGMTFSLEPKMVFEDEFSAGVESVFLVTESGARLISKVPLEIFLC